MRDVVPETGDLANAGGPYEHEPEVAHEVDLLDLWGHVLVHEGLIEFDGEVRHSSQATHDGVSASVPHEISEQAVELLHLNRWQVLIDVLSIETRLLVGKSVLSVGASYTATITRSKMREARRTMSRCPLVTGSNLPA